jgi:hypothetical protein
MWSRERFVFKRIYGAEYSVVREGLCGRVRGSRGSTGVWSLSIFLSWMVPSYGVYMSQFIILFARVCDNVSGFNSRNLVRTEKNFYTKSDISNLVKYFKKKLFVKAVI